MAEVTFYLLATQSLQERYLFACKLIEKAYRSGDFCHVLTDSVQQSQIMDDLLWTFRAGSFIPHKIINNELSTTEPAVSQILITSNNDIEVTRKTVVNLSSQCPNAERVLEILDDSEATKTAGRVRYRHYQQSDLTITTHKMSSSAQ